MAWGCLDPGFSIITPQCLARGQSKEGAQGSFHRFVGPRNPGPPGGGGGDFMGTFRTELPASGCGLSKGHGCLGPQGRVA